MAESSGDAERAGPRESPHALLKGGWGLRWVGAMLTASLLGTAAFLAFDRNGWSVAWITLLGFPVGIGVTAMAVVSVAMRRGLRRFAPVHLQDATAAVIGAGVLAAAVPVALFFFGGDLLTPGQLSIEDVVGLVAPAGLAGGIASYIAERRVSARSMRWWVLTVGVGVVGALLATVLLSVR